jgi:hypothetical protein
VGDILSWVQSRKRINILSREMMITSLDLIAGLYYSWHVGRFLHYFELTGITRVYGTPVGLY